MKTVYLDASRYMNAEDVHRSLKLLLDLPEYYGANADALYYCLSERREPVNLFIRHEAMGDAADALRKTACVVEDLGGKVVRMP